MVVIGGMSSSSNSSGVGGVGRVVVRADLTGLLRDKTIVRFIKSPDNPSLFSGSNFHLCYHVN